MTFWPRNSNAICEGKIAQLCAVVKSTIYRRKLKFWNCVFQTLYFHIMWKKFLLHRHFKGMKYTGKQTGRVLQNFVSIFFSKKIGLGWEENRILFLSTSKEVKTKPVAGCLIFVRCTLVFQDALVFYTIFPKHNIHEICILCFFFHQIESCVDWRCTVCTVHPSAHAAIIFFSRGSWQHGRVEWKNIIY